MTIAIRDADSLRPVTVIQLLSFAIIIVLAVIATAGCWHVPGSSRMFRLLAICSLLASILHFAFVITTSVPQLTVGPTPFTALNSDFSDAMWAWWLPRLSSILERAMFVLLLSIWCDALSNAALQRSVSTNNSPQTAHDNSASNNTLWGRVCGFFGNHGAVLRVASRAFFIETSIVVLCGLVALGASPNACMLTLTTADVALDIILAAAVVAVTASLRAMLQAVAGRSMTFCCCKRSDSSGIGSVNNSNNNSNITNSNITNSKNNNSNSKNKKQSSGAAVDIHDGLYKTAGGVSKDVNARAARVLCTLNITATAVIIASCLRVTKSIANIVDTANARSDGIIWEGPYGGWLLVLYLIGSFLPQFTILVTSLYPKYRRILLGQALAAWCCRTMRNKCERKLPGEVDTVSVGQVYKLNVRGRAPLLRDVDPTSTTSFARLGFMDSEDEDELIERSI